MRRGDAVGEKRLAPIAVKLAEQRLELTEGSWVYWAALILFLPMFVVVLLQGDVVFAIGAGVVIAYLVYWLLVGRSRMRAKLERALERNRALVATAKPAPKKRVRKSRPG